MIQDFISLIFPRLCIICEQGLGKGEPEICVACQCSLPKTNYHMQRENELAQRFWGKINILQSMAYLSFQKRGIVQKLLYQIKYKNKKEAAELIGRWYGCELREHGLKFDLIVPVPLHQKKMKLRGYNQSEYFAKGLAKAFEIEYCNVLERLFIKSSQTNKSRFQRWENVEGIYELNNLRTINGMHILLVDDVVTTGATLEVCGNQLLRGGAKGVSIAVIACAQ